MKVTHVVHWKNSGITSAVTSLCKFSDQTSDCHEVITLRNSKRFSDLVSSVVILFRLVVQSFFTKEICVQAHSPLPMLIIPFVRADRKVVTFHSNYPFIKDDSYRSILKRITLRAAIKVSGATVTSVGSESQEIVSEWLKKKVLCIENGFQTGDYKPPSRFNGVRTLGFSGRLDSEKNVISLIKAMAQVSGNLKLIVAGNGEEFEKAKSLIKELSLEEQITLLGHVDDMKGFYQRIDTLVSVSFFEGFGMAIAEAMLSGKAVVSTDVGLVKENPSLLVVKTKEDPESIAGAINKLACMDKEEIDKYIRSNAKIINDRYEIGKVYEKYRSGVWES